MASSTVRSSIEPRTPNGVFRNEPFTDFKDPETARAMKAALDMVAGQLGREYDLIIGGERIKTAARSSRSTPRGRRRWWAFIRRPGPSTPSRPWRRRSQPLNFGAGAPAGTASSLILGAAEIIRQRKFEILRVADLRGGQELGRGGRRRGRDHRFSGVLCPRGAAAGRGTTQYSTQANVMSCIYIPLGVGAVIPPWNFPFAIMAGMTAASIVTGNTVILKPSSDSPTIAAKFVEVLEEAGMPGGVVNFCPGSGATFGNAIVEHPEDAVYRIYRIEGGGAGYPRAGRPDASRGRSGSSGPSWRWAARIRSWCVRMPIWTRQWMAWWRRHSDSAGRSARLARGPLSRRQSTTFL